MTIVVALLAVFVTLGLARRRIGNFAYVAMGLAIGAYVLYAYSHPPTSACSNPSLAPRTVPLTGYCSVERTRVCVPGGLVFGCKGGPQQAGIGPFYVGTRSSATTSILHAQHSVG